jgi:hypothetical protein
MTWLCPDTEQAASSLALLRGLASQVRTGKPHCYTSARLVNVCSICAGAPWPCVEGDSEFAPYLLCRLASSCRSLSKAAC